ncbi:hypothetical protein ACXM5X_12335 [Pseudomonas saponiphila]
MARRAASPASTPASGPATAKTTVCDCASAAQCHSTGHLPRAGHEALFVTLYTEGRDIITLACVIDDKDKDC